MPVPPNPNQKYRPYFTLAELITLRDSTISASPLSHSLISYLDSYITDIQRGNRAANHTVQPSLEQKLGLDDSPSRTISPLHSGKTLYEQWKNNIPLTPAEIILMNQYRYENDLMTSSEEVDWEISQGVR